MRMLRINMGRVKSRQEAAHKRAQQEDTIRKALNAVETMNKDGKPEMSLQESSKAFGIPFSTLQGRWNGARPHFIAHQNQQILTGFFDGISTIIKSDLHISRRKQI